jgi:TolB protein
MTVRAMWGVILCILVLAASSVAHAVTVIQLDQPVDQKFPIAVTNLVKGEGYSDFDSMSKKLPEIVRNDLELSSYFKIVPPSLYPDKNNPDMTSDKIDFAKWRAIGANALIKGIVYKDGGRVTVQLKLFDAQTGEMQLGKEYTADKKDVRTIAHRFADDVMLAVTGTRGVFNTKIAYTSLVGKKKGKSIYVMDMDGFNNQRVTKDSSMNLGPAWSPDGKKLAYASYVNGFPDIYTVDLGSGHVRQLTNNRSTNITPAWSPDGDIIMYSSAKNRDPDLFIVNPNTGAERAFSSAFGIDLGPRFSPDGDAVVFASERGGNLNIYKQSLKGGLPQKLSFHGYQNDSPDWSPDSTKITFHGRSGGAYDVFTMNADGTNVQRLTVGAGNNEHPRWSPDSRYIVFSSTRDGHPAVYIMRFDGANPVRISKGNGELPSWGPWDKRSE